NIAREMRIERSAVNVKATTTEKLGFVERGEGMASEAVVSIIRG
ncbi:MAG: 2-C-methyl-D-erythritol 2,4-cyclodiphosphate synthase, partial [Enterococcus sp.]|nr:2-C-methyl-D-erythritol 2,4-cyclodiphosphate synthase [Enterococcus sp.]